MRNYILPIVGAFSLTMGGFIALSGTSNQVKAQTNYSSSTQPHESDTSLTAWDAQQYSKERAEFDEIAVPLQKTVPATQRTQKGSIRQNYTVDDTGAIFVKFSGGKPNGFSNSRYSIELKRIILPTDVPTWILSPMRNVQVNITDFIYPGLYQVSIVSGAVINSTYSNGVSYSTIHGKTLASKIVAVYPNQITNINF